MFGEARVWKFLKILKCFVGAIQWCCSWGTCLMLYIKYPCWGFLVFLFLELFMYQGGWLYNPRCTLNVWTPKQWCYLPTQYPKERWALDPHLFHPSCLWNCVIRVAGPVLMEVRALYPLANNETHGEHVCRAK